MKFPEKRASSFFYIFYVKSLHQFLDEKFKTQETCISRHVHNQFHDIFKFVTLLAQKIKKKIREIEAPRVGILFLFLFPFIPTHFTNTPPRGRNKIPTPGAYY